MKKSYFLLLCSMLLSVGLFTISCSGGESTPAPEPTFPAKVTKVVAAGEPVALSFEANYDWTATISQNTYTYFQLMNGETKTNTLTGAAGTHTITVSVADIPVYESAPIATVTLEMNGKKQVIAELTYPTSERSLGFYAPEPSEYGGYKGGEYGGAYAYAYNQTEMAADDTIVMDWGVERGNEQEDPADTFFAPVLISADFDYTLVGPEWMLAAEAGEAGVQEHIIKANLDKIPENTTACNIDVLVSGTQTVVGSFSVTITGSGDFLLHNADYMEYSYSYNGLTGEKFEMEYVGGQGAKCILLNAEGENTDWISMTVVADDSTSKIKHYEASIAPMQTNEGERREAYLFITPKNIDVNDSFINNGEFTALGEQYAVAKITQHAVPATIEGLQIDETCVTFSEVGANFANPWIFEEPALMDKYIGNKYDVYYWGEGATNGHEATSFVASRPIASLTAYAYVDSGSLLPLEEDNLWVTANTFDDEGTKFKIVCPDTSVIPSAAQNWQTNDYEAVILVEYIDGTYSAIYFHINDSGSEDEGGNVAFAQPEYASMMGASLQKLEAGDELYNNYFYEYSSDAYPADMYVLTYSYPILETSSLNCVSLTGIESYRPYVVTSDWCSWNSTNNYVTMDPAGLDDLSQVGAVLFKDDMGLNQVVILCRLLSLE